MKINSVQHDIALKKGGFGYNSSNYKEKCDVRGYSANYCGSFTGNESKAAASFLDKILKSKWFEKFTKYSHDHNISTSALIALVLAGIMRPATIMALPGKKDKEDKIYASGHAIATGIMGFVISTITTSPFDESIEKVFDQKKFACGKFKELDEKIAELTAQKDVETITEEAKKVVEKELKALTEKREALKTLAKNIPDWFIAVPRAMLTIALIPPILKYVFGIEKKKKQTPPQEQKVEIPKMDFIDKDVFKNVKGGVQ